MEIKLLEVVALTRDLTDHGLKSGDTGTVVEIYEPDGVEIEFLTGAGTTKAVLTLSKSDVRSLRSDDILAVRSVTAA